MKKPNILLTNDDGINAKGLFALFEEVKKIANIFVVAPDSEKSASGHSITLATPLRVWEFKKNGSFFGYAVNGTPADCVKIACSALLDESLDMIISGINHGPNTATDILYSGTVSACTEGVILNIPSIAFSLTSFRKQNFDYAAEFARNLIEKVLEKGLPYRTLLNVNIPPVPKEQIEGVEITRQGKARYEEYFDKRVDPAGRVYYWMSGTKIDIDTEEGIDETAVRQNKISITPVRYHELTNLEMLEELKAWNIEK